MGRSDLLLSMAAVIVGFFLISTSAGAYAAASSTYVLDPKLASESAAACAGIRGSWFNINSTCLVRASFDLASGSLIKVEPGASLDLLSILEVGSGARIANYGTIIANQNSEIYNKGIIDNFKGGIINSTGDIANMNFYSIYSTGTIINHEGGTVLQVSRRGIATFHIFVNNGTFVNTGTIDNFGEGRFETHGIIANKGEINNRIGKLAIYGTVDNQKGGRIYNDRSGIISIYGEGRIINDGTLFNRGRIEINGNLANKGRIDNYGPIFNNRSTINNSSGTVINHNIGSINNKAVLDNYGNITSIFGRISNSGSIKSYCGSFIDGTISGDSAANTCISATTTTTTTITTVTSTRSTVQRIEEPTLYIWGVSATAAAVILALGLLLQRRTRS